MKTIKFNLSEAGINHAIQEVKEYKAEFKAKCQMLMEALTTAGAEIARAKVASLGAVYSGHLLSSIDGYYSPTLNAGFIRVNAEYGMFIEFGTGVKGKSSSHPNGEYLAKANYSYMGGTTYITTQDGRVGWFYPADDGTWKFTEGQGSRPFLWQTAKELELDFKNIVQGVFKG